MNMNEGIKHFKSYKNQRSLLTQRDLIVRGNPLVAEHYLSEYSYYNLANGIGRYYTHLSRDKNNNVIRIFNQGVSLNYLVALLSFDQDVRGVLFPQILNIETSLKTKLSYTLGQVSSCSNDRINHIGYLNPKLYNCNSDNEDLKNLRKRVKRPLKKEYVSTPLYHYKKCYDNIPPWILITGLTFGQAIYWFKILKSKYQMKIIKQMLGLWDKNYKGLLKPWRVTYLFRQCLNILVTFRNACAHGDIISFVNVKIPSETKNKEPLYYESMISKLLLGYVNKAHLNKNTIIQHGDFCNVGHLYSCILAIILLTDDRRQLIHFLQHVKILFKESSNLSVSPSMGIPRNAYERISNFINKDIYY